MSFQLSPDLDSNKIFLVQRSELEGRFDPHFYRPEFIENEKRLEKVNCSRLLQHSISIFSGITPKSGGDAYCDKQDGIPFVRSGDFLEDGKINFDELLYIKPEIHNGIMKGSKIWKNDLLVAIVGATIGKIGIYKDDRDANINQAIAAVRLLPDLTPEYVRAFLLTSVGQKVIDRIKRPVARANINLKEVKSFTIPIPPKAIQAQIVAKMDAAYAAKKQKETEAQRLLNSIDNYLLDELGIELPEQEANTLQSRIFTRQLSEVSGGRFDPFFSSLNKQDKSGKYKFYKLKELARIRKGDSITSYDAMDGSIPVIAGGQTSPYNHNKSNSNGDVITVSASGAYSGYIWYHKNSIYASDCTMISSKNTDKLINKFIFEYLKTVQQDIYNLQQGSGQPHVYPSDLEKIKIPIPPHRKTKRNLRPHH